MDDRTINGSVGLNGRVYGAPEADELYEDAQEAGVDLTPLVDAGTLEGDWGVSSAPEGDDSAAGDSADEVDATDSARELAEKHDIDLAEVDGTGSDGRIVKSDVQALVEE